MPHFESITEFIVEARPAVDLWIIFAVDKAT